MECRLKVENPGEIEYTMTITMSAEQWERLRTQIQQGESWALWPSRGLISYIDDLLAQARKIYWPQVDKDGHTAEERARAAQFVTSGMSENGLG